MHFTFHNDPADLHWCPCRTRWECTWCVLWGLAFFGFSFFIAVFWVTVGIVPSYWADQLSCRISCAHSRQKWIASLFFTYLTAEQQSHWIQVLNSTLALLNMQYFYYILFWPLVKRTDNLFKQLVTFKGYSEFSLLADTYLILLVPIGRSLFILILSSIIWIAFYTLLIINYTLCVSIWPGFFSL